MNVRFSRRALRDLEEIADYIAADSPPAGARVRRAIVRIVDLISKHPYVGIENARNPELRSVLVTPYPYRLHYRVRNGTLWVVHIRHSSRRAWRGGAT